MEFVKKSAEEIAKMSGEEMAKYYNDFNDHKRKELESLVSAQTKANDDKLALEIKTLKEELASNQVEQLKSLNETLKQHGLMIKKMADGSKGERTINSISKSLEDNKEKLGRMKDTKESIEFKAASTMLISSNVSGGNVPVEQRLDGINNIADRRIRLLDVVSRGTASSNVISWVYQANRDGSAGVTGEGAAKNQIDFDLVVASESVKKLTAYIKVSDEMLEDIDFMESEIRNELSIQLLKAVETQVYSGAGTGNNLNGIKTVATTFAAGSLAGTVDNANEVDVLTAAQLQIELAEQEGATAVFVHPSTIAKLKTAKVSATDKRYVERLAMVAGQLSFDGIPLIPTTLITAGEFLMADFTKATVYDKGAVSYKIGFENDDFTKNLVTILAEWRGLVVVKNNDRTAFIKGVFATAQAALETA